ncbi:MAG: efflux RND transporter periplasmic adaptor subunit [Synergistales bacterium]|jgi:RND family efflux transporter MFP subunit
MKSLKARFQNRKTLAWVIIGGVALGFLVFRVAFPPRKVPAVSISSIRAEKGLPVTTTVAEAKSLDIRRSYYGLVRSVKIQEVTAYLREMVESVKVEVGDPVRAGEVLAVLSGREQAAAAAADRESVAEAKRDVERMRVLFNEGGVSRSELDQAVVRLRALEAEMVSSGTRSARTMVRAKIDGVVTERHAEAGEIAEAGRVLLVIQDTGSLEIEVLLPQADRLYIVGGTDVEVPLEDRIVRGSVKRLDPAADPQTGLFRAIVSMPPDRALLPGATVEARILVKRSLGGVVLPSGIVQREGDESFVYVVSGDVVRRRVIALGEGADDQVEVRSGLKPGETVVAEGSSALYDGARIWIQTDEPVSGEKSP